MPETVTIVGGKSLSVYLDQSEVQAAQAALTAAAGANTQSEIYTSLSDAPAPNAFDVYTLTPSSHAVDFNLTSSTSTVVLQGSAAARVNGATSATGQLIIGNAGNDTIRTTGGSGEIIVGDGKNSISVSGGTQQIVTGAATSANAIALSGADVAISGSAKNTVTVAGSDTISSGAARVIAHGNDTITLGSGSDTVLATGAATIYGGSGALHLLAKDGADVYAGSGRETLAGTGGTFNFYGSTSSTAVDIVHGGAGTNLFEGGAGHDILISGAAKGATSDVFEFSSSIAGGTHLIEQFSTATDQLELNGYTQQDITSFKNAGGNTVIRLDDGTSITVRGVTLSEGSIKFGH